MTKGKEIPARVSWDDLVDTINPSAFDDYPASIQYTFHANDARLDYLEVENQKLQRDLEFQDKQSLVRQNQIVAKLEKQLDQQKFNNKHNLSIDQSIADKISEQARVIEKLKSALSINTGCDHLTRKCGICKGVAKEALNELKSEGKDGH